MTVSVRCRAHAGKPRQAVTANVDVCQSAESCRSDPPDRIPRSWGANPTTVVCPVKRRADSRRGIQAGAHDDPAFKAMPRPHRAPARRARPLAGCRLRRQPVRGGRIRAPRLVASAVPRSASRRRWRREIRGALEEISDGSGSPSSSTAWAPIRPSPAGRTFTGIIISRRPGSLPCATAGRTSPSGRARSRRRSPWSFGNAAGLAICALAVARAGLHRDERGVLSVGSDRKNSAL